MENFKIVHDLLMEVGPLIEALEIAEYEEARTWTVLVEDFLVILECDEDNALLHISTVLASPAKGVRSKLYVEALRYSARMQAHGGFRIGVLEKDGDLVFVQSKPIVKFDRNEFYSLLKTYIEEARKASQMVEAFAPAAEEQNHAPDSMMFHV